MLCKKWLSQNGGLVSTVFLHGLGTAIRRPSAGT